MSNSSYPSHVNPVEKMVGKDQNGELVAVDRYTKLDPNNKAGFPVGTLFDRKTGRYITPHAHRESWGGNDPRWGGKRSTAMAVHADTNTPGDWR